MYLAKTLSVAAGSPAIIDLLGWPAPTTIAAIPGGGGTLNIETSTTATAVSNPGAASWTAWPAGAVAIKTTDTLDSPVVALRVTAAAATGSFEMAA